MVSPKGIYARISDDSDASSAGVGRQVKDGLAICEMRGWSGETYVDNDLSAFQKKVIRPEFERLLRDLGTGALSGIVGYNLDRLFRQPRDLERTIDIYDDNPDLTFSTVEGDINLATADGRTMARVMVAFANKASADTGRRTKRKHLELAEKGEPVGRRAFGWQEDKRTLDPTEAAQARRVVEDLLNGTPIRQLVSRWNDEGIRTTTGKLWSHQTLRKYLLNPRLVGERTYRGVVLLDQSGSAVTGTWEPLLDRDTWDRLQLVLRPSRKGVGPRPRRGARKYHLTGLLRCGRCHGLMFGSRAREPGRFNYVCNGPSSAAGRHTVAASGLIVDRIVDALVFGFLSRESVERQPSRAWDGAARRNEVEQQIEKLMAAFMAGTLSEGVVFPRVEALERERNELNLERQQWLATTTGVATLRETPLSWSEKSPEQRRAAADKVLKAIYVKPAAARGVRFDPERLVPVWASKTGTNSGESGSV